jgi:DNA-binding transcriptional MerR regulator
MRLSIGSLSRLSGVSIRALHHYDRLALLPPSDVSASGYRYYNDAAVERLWQILFYRELGFPLKDIAGILSSPEFDRERALSEHLSLLEKKRERLDRLIELVSDAMKGVPSMEFKAFDTQEIDDARNRYAEEAKARWGETQAYRESAWRTAQYTKEDFSRIQEPSAAVFRAFAELAGASPSDPQVQVLVQRWQTLISESYYFCSNEILADLGQMYIADRRFTENLDRYGAGTAKLMSDAIAVYCAKEK